MKRPLGTSLERLGGMLAGRGRGDAGRTRVYCLGAAKTGTHTIAEMFGDRVAAAHEGDAADIIRLVLEGKRDSAEMLDLLAARDRRRRLWIDSSQVNLYLVDAFEQLFPGSRYIVTLRTPAAWLNSIIDDSLRRETSEIWHRFRDFRFGAKAAPSGPERALGERSLYRVEGYLGYWAFASGEALSKAPADRRLIVPTTEIARRAAEIAAFCGLPDPDRPPAVVHAFGNPVRSGLLAGIDRDHLLAELERVAGPLARTLFPGWTAAADLDRALAPPGGAAAG